MGSMAKFEELVQVEVGVPLTTTLHIAEGAKVTHRAVLQLCKTHMNYLESFGRVAFEMRPFATNGGEQTMRILTLNEGQATFLMTLLKNTEPVVAFKAALVKAFLAARNLITTDYMSLAKQHAALSVELENERELASFSGHSLSMWKQKHKRLKSALEDVQQKMQPCLNFD